jgi:hypothetical protein
MSGVLVFASAIIGRLGLAGCAVVLALAYYEGIPGFNRLPFLDRVPLLREFVIGRVELERRAAVAGMVSAAELAALRAQLAEAERLRSIADDAAAAERERAAGLAKIGLDRETARQKRAAEAATRPGLTLPSEEDLKWIERLSR